MFWLSGADNNAAISEFVVYYRDWSPAARSPPPFNRSALTEAHRPPVLGALRYIPSS